MSETSAPSQKSNFFSTNRKAVGVILVMLTIISYSLAMVLPYYDFPGATSLISDGSNLAFNLPVYLLLLGSGLSLFIAHSPTSSILLLILVVTFVLSGSMIWLVDWLLGKSSPGAGAVADLFVTIFGSLGIWSLWSYSKFNLEMTKSAMWWAVLAVTITLLYQIGSFMNWTKTTHRITNGTSTWKTTGSRTWVKQCCVPFQDSTASVNIRTGLEILFSFLLVLFFMFITPRFMSGIAILSLGITFLSHPLSWLVTIANTTPDPKSIGFGADTVSQNGIVVFVSGLPGGWIALGASVMLILQGVFICLSARLLKSSGAVLTDSHSITSN